MKTCTKKIASLLPGLDRDILEVHRLGQSRPDSDVPRLVRAKLTSAGKTRMFDSRKSLKLDDRAVYVNHDLSPVERARRKKCVPVFKKLRASGVRCTLPRDVILKDGKPMGESEIAIALGDCQ